MKLVHEIGQGKYAPQASCSGETYYKPFATTYPGFQVSLVMVGHRPLSHEEEPIHIEGDGQTIKYLLQNALHALEAQECRLKELWDEEQKKHE